MTILCFEMELLEKMQTDHNVNALQLRLCFWIPLKKTRIQFLKLNNCIYFFQPEANDLVRQILEDTPVGDEASNVLKDGDIRLINGRSEREVRSID